MSGNKHRRLGMGMHSMNVFGCEFDDGSFCWMMESGELWLSMIIVKEEHRHKGVLHRLLDAAKKVSDCVIIPEPMNFVPIAAAKRGYVATKRYIEDFDEYINVMEWRRDDEPENHR